MVMYTYNTHFISKLMHIFKNIIENAPCCTAVFVIIKIHTDRNLKDLLKSSH